MEKINVELFEANNKMVEPFETVRLWMAAYNRLSEKIVVPARALAATATARGRRLVQAGPNLVWSIPAMFNEAADLMYLPIQRKTLARLRASVWAEVSPEAEFHWVEEVDPVDIKDEDAIVLVDPEVDEIVDPEVECDALELPGVGDVGVIPIKTLVRNAGPLYRLFQGYGGAIAPRRYEFK